MLGYLRRIEPVAVIADREMETAVVTCQIDDQSAGVGVFGNIVERLLRYPVDSQAHLWGEVVIEVEADLCRDVVTCCEAVR